MTAHGLPGGFTIFLIGCFPVLQSRVQSLRARALSSAVAALASRDAVDRMLDQAGGIGHPIKMIERHEWSNEHGSFPCWHGGNAFDDFPNARHSPGRIYHGNLAK